MARLINYLSELEGTESIALYGAGGLGKYIRQQVAEEMPQINIVSFIDDNKTESIDGVPVCKLENLDTASVDLILISSSYWKDIEKQLQAQGIEHYAIANLIGELEDEPISTKVSVRGAELEQFTPNRTLEVIAKHFEKIEPQTLDWIDSFEEGASFYDVGASNGMFSIYAAVKKNSEVVAFEPDAQNFAVLEQNHYLNSKQIDTGIISLNLALSEKSGLFYLYSLNYSAGSHSKFLHDPVDRGGEEVHRYDHRQAIITDSLDGIIERLDLPFPKYLKIDVDGAEGAVLKGAQKTLADARLQSLLIEVVVPAADNNTAALIAGIEGHGFQLKEQHTIHEIVGTPVEGVVNLLFEK